MKNILLLVFIAFITSCTESKTSKRIMELMSLDSEAQRIRIISQQYDLMIQFSSNKMDRETYVQKYDSLEKEEVYYRNLCMAEMHELDSLNKTLE